MQEKLWESLRQAQDIEEFRQALGENYFACKSQELPDKDVLSRLTSLFCIVSDIQQPYDAESGLTSEMFTRLKACLEAIAQANPGLLINPGIRIIDNYILMGDSESAALLKEFQNRQGSSQLPLDPP